MSLRDFIVLNKLGSGSFSEVFKVKRITDNKLYALKKVQLNQLGDKEKENSLNEVRILASIQNECIIGYKEAFFEESTSTLCVVMEYADNGDLQGRMEQLRKNKELMPEEEIWDIAIKLLNGLFILHNMKIVHRDIKCANIFLGKDGSVKLGDLNVSKIAKLGLMQTQTGTPYYASPEVWQDKPYDAKCDLWSLGCVIYECAAQHPPFLAADMNGLYQKVIKGVYPNLSRNFSAELNHLISQMLIVDPKLRPSAAQMLQLNSILRRQGFSRNSSSSCDTGVNAFLAMAVAAQQSNPGQLLSTIRVPKNLKQLTERLPKSQYEDNQTMQRQKTSGTNQGSINASTQLENTAGKSGKIKIAKMRQSSSSGGECGSTASTDASNTANTGNKSRLHQNSRKILENLLSQQNQLLIKNQPQEPRSSSGGRSITGQLQSSASVNRLHQRLVSQQISRGDLLKSKFHTELESTATVNIEKNNEQSFPEVQGGAQQNPGSILGNHESLKNLLANDRVKSSIKKLREKSQRILASKFKQQASQKSLAQQPSQGNLLQLANGMTSATSDQQQPRKLSNQASQFLPEIVQVHDLIERKQKNHSLAAEIVSECKRYSTQNVESVLSSVQHHANLDDASSFDNDSIDGQQSSRQRSRLQQQIETLKLLRQKQSQLNSQNHLRQKQMQVISEKLNIKQSQIISHQNSRVFPTCETPSNQIQSNCEILIGSSISNDQSEARVIQSTQSRKHLRIESQLVLPQAPLSTRSNAQLITKYKNDSNTLRQMPQSVSNKNLHESQRSEVIRRILKHQQVQDQLREYSLHSPAAIGNIQSNQSRVAASGVLIYPQQSVFPNSRVSVLNYQLPNGQSTTVDENIVPPPSSQLSKNNLMMIPCQMRKNANSNSNQQQNIFSRRAHPIVNMKLFNLPQNYQPATPQTNSSKKINNGQRINQYRQQYAAASAFDIFEPEIMAPNINDIMKEEPEFYI